MQVGGRVKKKKTSRMLTLLFMAFIHSSFILSHITIWHVVYTKKGACAHKLQGNRRVVLRQPGTNILLPVVKVLVCLMKQRIFQQTTFIQSGENSGEQSHTYFKWLNE